MPQNIFAYTPPGNEYPEYVSVNRQDDGTITLDVRGPAIPPSKDRYPRHAAPGPFVRVVLPYDELRKLAECLAELDREKLGAHAAW